MTPPVFILAPPRSFTSVTSSMLGQHPDLLGVPELNLFITEEMSTWWVAQQGARAVHANGLVRAVAHLYFGEQNEETAELARSWLRHRLHWTTAEVFHALAARAHPRGLVDKSPLNLRAAALPRVALAFPNARYLHLVRDPVERAPSVRATLAQLGIEAPDLDPVHRWYVLNRRILDFLHGVPAERTFRLRGEELLADPDRHLRRLATWLGVRADPEAIARMKHPERSPFARFGPPSAPLGHDIQFLQRPALRARDQTATTAVRRDGQRAHVPAEVNRLARALGYSTSAERGGGGTRCMYW